MSYSQEFLIAPKPNVNYHGYDNWPSLFNNQYSNAFTNITGKGQKQTIVEPDGNEYTLSSKLPLALARMSKLIVKPGSGGSPFPGPYPGPYIPGVGPTPQRQPAPYPHEQPFERASRSGPNPIMPLSGTGDHTAVPESLHPPSFDPRLTLSQRLQMQRGRLSSTSSDESRSLLSGSSSTSSGSSSTSSTTGRPPMVPRRLSSTSLDESQASSRSRSTIISDFVESQRRLSSTSLYEGQSMVGNPSVASRRSSLLQESFDQPLVGGLIDSTLYGVGTDPSWLPISGLGIQSTMLPDITIFSADAIRTNPVSSMQRPGDYGFGTSEAALTGIRGPELSTGLVQAKGVGLVSQAELIGAVDDVDDVGAVGAVGDDDYDEFDSFLTTPRSAARQVDISRGLNVTKENERALDSMQLRDTLDVARERHRLVGMSQVGENGRELDSTMPMSTLDVARERHRRKGG